MKPIVVIGAGEYQVSGINKLKELGYYVIAFDGNKGAVGKNYADEFINIDIKDSDKIINILKENNIEPLTAMCFASEIALNTVAEINNYFNLVGLTKDEVSIATNKEKQRKLQKKNNLLHPKYFTCKRNDDIIKKLLDSKINFPVIIKPVDSSGSRGVFYIKNKRNLLNKINLSFKNSISNEKIIIEEYIPGKEITVESIIINKEIYTLGISEKKKPLDNHTVSSELFYYSAFVQKHKKQIEETINNFLKLCNIKNTIVHSELMYSYKNHKFYIIEFSVRSGGFYIADKVLPIVTGLDINKLIINTLLGKGNIPNKYSKKTCILRFLHSNQGVISKININTEYIQKIINVEYGLFVKEGHKVRPIDSDGARLGYIISYANTWQQAFNKANITEAAIDFEII